MGEFYREYWSYQGIIPIKDKFNWQGILRVELVSTFLK